MKKIIAIIIISFTLISCQKSIDKNQNSTKKEETKDTIVEPNNIYDKRIDNNNVDYKKIKTSTITGLSKLSCDKEFTRFLDLPNKEEIRLILIPIDCGDFDYRYYLLTIKNDRIVSDLYVEGVWSEPDSDDGDEITTFSIDKNFIIQVKTEFNNETKIKKYSIDKNGLISEL